MKKQADARTGFTLVEVIVAMSIFSMVIAGGLSGLVQGLKIVETSRHHTRISQILQSEVESIRTLSWKELNALPDCEEVSIDAQFTTASYEVYTVTRTVIKEQNDRKRIEVSVGFANRQGKQVSLKYITFFTQGGVNDYYYRTI